MSSNIGSRPLIYSCMTIRVTAQNVKRKWRHCDTRRSRVSQLNHLSLTLYAVTRMGILHSSCNMVQIFNHIRSLRFCLSHMIIRRLTARCSTVP